MPPLHAAGGDHDRRRDLDAALDVHLEWLAPTAASAGDAQPDDQLRTEALGLTPRQARELGAADPAGEAEEVLDHRRVGGLTAWHVVFEDQRREPVRGGVD